MNKKNETTKAIEAIIEHKAKLIVAKKEHTKHIQEFLEYFFKDSDFNFKDIPVDVFKICAVDAMIFDVGAALGFAQFRRSEK